MPPRTARQNSFACKVRPLIIVNGSIDHPMCRTACPPIFCFASFCLAFNFRYAFFHRGNGGVLSFLQAVFPRLAQRRAHKCTQIVFGRFA